MKATLRIFIILLVAGSAFAIPAPDTLWTRTYGGVENDEAMSVQQTSDGGYISVGYTFSFEADGDVDAYLMKLNSEGDTVWTRTFSGYGNEAAYSVKQTVDGGYIFSGFAGPVNANGLYLVKTDQLGYQVWARTYAMGTGANGLAVRQTADGGYLVAGNIIPTGGTWGINDGYIIKTNSVGDTEWTQTCGGAGNERFFSVGETNDSGFFAAGWRYESWEPPDGNWDMYLVKLDADGDTVWTRIFTGLASPRQQVAEAAIQTIDGGFLLAGWQDTGHNQPFIVKTNAQGALQWSKVYTLPESGGAFKSVVQLSDRTFVLAGIENSPSTGQKVLLMRISNTGDSIWSCTYGGIEQDMGLSIESTMDGGYIVAGFTHSFGSGGSDFYLIKTSHDSYLCGNLSGVISATNSPYYVTCDLVVPLGDTLVIEPGVVLNFAGPYKFEVQGTLIAEGTEEDSIIFTTDQSGSNRWQGIRFYDSTSTGSRLAYCVIEKGYAVASDGWPAWHAGGALCWNGSSPTFKHCIFRQNSCDGDGGAVHCEGSSSPSFTNCVFRDNLALGPYYGNGGAVDCYHASPSFIKCIFSSNSAANEGGGVFCAQYSSPTFTSCTFSGNSASVHGGGIACANSSPVIENTIVALSSGSGFYFNNSSGSQIKYSDLFGNSGGAFGGTVPPGLGQIVTANRNGDPCDAYYNIFLDPLFVNAGAGDYHLTANSPCIDAGDPAMYDPDCTPSDIGAFYYFHLAQPESLIVQQDGRDMVLRWSIVDSTECGYPTPIKSYVIYYEQNFGENWDYLTAVTDTTYRHENVVLFAPSMYYKVVATDVELDYINRAARPGMSQKEFLAALRRAE